MKQAQILALARDAGFKVYEGAFPFEPTEDKFIGFEDNLERFAALVAAHEREKATEYRLKLENVLAGCEAAVLAEREACAKVCEDLIAKGYQLEGELDLCAAAIRARNEK